VIGPLASSATAERIAGFRSALAEHGHILDDRQVVTRDGTDHVKIGYQCAASLVRSRRARRFGLFCARDLIAYGAHRAVTEAGPRGCPATFWLSASTITR